MEEFEVERRSMLTAEEWCDPVSKISHHMKKWFEWRGDWAGMASSRIVAAFEPASRGLSSDRL